jgi:tetratricopeptide (TPR) repeat protein
MLRIFPYIFGGILIGLTVGFLAANYTTRTSVAGQAAIAGVGTEPAIAQQQPEGQTGMMPDILEVIQEADNNKQDFELQIRAGALYARISRPEKALEYFNNAAALNPTDVMRVRTLADAFFDIRDFSKSRGFYLRANQMKPLDVEILTPLGVTFLATEPPDFNQGLFYMQQALDLDSTYQPVIVNMGLAYVKMGDREKAREMRDRLNGIAPNSALVARLDEALKNAPFSRR